VFSKNRKQANAQERTIESHVPDCARFLCSSDSIAESGLFSAVEMASRKLLRCHVLLFEQTHGIGHDTSASSPLSTISHWLFCVVFTAHPVKPDLVFLHP
jgi:hypothetical protein